MVDNAVLMGREEAEARGIRIGVARDQRQQWCVLLQTRLPGHEQHQWNELLVNFSDGIDFCGDNGCPTCIPNFEQRQHHTSPEYLGEAEEEAGAGGPGTRAPVAVV